MSTEITIVPVLADKIPEFAKDLYPRFVQFMRDYLSFLEEDGNFLRVLLDWNHNTDPLNNVEPYIDAFLRDLGFESGQNLEVDKSLLLHNLKEFYLARGSEASFKFLFRALFNEDVEIRYPRDQLLVPSSAAYQVQHFVYTTATTRNTEMFRNLIARLGTDGGVMRGMSSGVVASIENITIRHGSGRAYCSIEIQQPIYEFESDEAVIIESGDYSISEIVKPIMQFEIVDGGNGYVEGDFVTVTGAKLPGKAVVESTTNGGITSVHQVLITRSLKAGDQIRAYSNDGGSGFSAYVSEVVGTNFPIGRFVITNEGYNYTEVPLIQVVGKEKQLVRGRSTKIGQIKSIKTTDPYVDFDNVTLSVQSAKGTGAIIEAKKVTRWTRAGWVDKKGVLGENSTLIDSDKYQQYSYSVVSSVPSTSYDSFLTDMLHPAGYVRTSTFEIISNINLDLDGDDSHVDTSSVYTYESVLNLTFIATHDIDSSVIIVTDIGTEIVTDIGTNLIITE